MSFRNPIVGGTSLIRQAIKSPGYTAGVKGWTINKDGSAEFNNLTVRGTFSGTDYTVDEDGIFFYNGVPGAGNMSGSWSPMDGTDPYGNSYTAGLTLYSPVGQVFLGGLDGIIESVGSSGATISIEDGQYNSYDAGDYAGAIMAQDLDRTHGSYYIGSGRSVVADINAVLGVITAYGTPTVGQQDTYPRTVTAAYLHGQPAHHYVTGSVLKADLTGNTGEKWQVPAYSSSNFAGGSTASTRYQALQYRMDAQDNVVVEGAFHATAAIALGSYTIFPLSGSYMPKKLHAFMGLHVSSADAFKAVLRVGVDSTGAFGITTTSAIAVGDNFYVYACAPLGNIA